jgi:choline dehydrogenase
VDSGHGCDDRSSGIFGGGGHRSNSVLDHQLRVRGVAGLRVADAFALPRIPRANTNAPAIMVGERCADFMLGACG